MENSVKRKINIFGKVAKIITMIVIVCLLVAEGFMLVGGVIVAAVPKDSVTVDAAVQVDAKADNEFFGIEEGKIGVKVGGTEILLGEYSTDGVSFFSEKGKTGVSAGIRDLHFDLNDALKLIVCGMVSVAAIVVALFFFRALMKQFMVCDSPFSEGVVKKMRNFAIALIPCTAVVMVMKSAFGAVFSHNFGFDIDFISIAFVFIIFVLTMIFKYGTELQKEHDETV
ncbi:MAG: DUF2975 domain-containing protein [Ruminococcus sp.]|nr:DUF2975 domain-containing protein [Ruminococcus sp.]